MIISKSTLRLMQVFRRRNVFVHLKLPEASFPIENLSTPVQHGNVYVERPRSKERYQLFGLKSRDWNTL